MLASDWSPDGALLCVTRTDTLGSADIVFVSTSGNHEVHVFLDSPFNESNGVFSPDGRWLAYESNETGQSEIYIRPLPGPGNAVKVSDSGGTSPVWSSDGREIYYVSGNNQTMSARVTAGRSNIEVTSTAVLFTRTALMSEYDVFPDNKRFLVNRTIEPTETDPVTLVINWTRKLKE